MNVSLLRKLLALTCLTGLVSAAEPDRLDQAPNTWVKRSPLKGGPPSPGMGYETSLGYDPQARLVIRWGGHNQGGGGEQNAELWTYDPRTGKWTLKEPNTSPPGVCCAQQNVFDLAHNRFLRFPAFSGSHGWHWFREIYLNNSTVWAYDLETNTWRDRRPVPAPRVSPLRCASWDSDHQVVVLFGGEGNQEGTVVYDPHANTWTRMNPPKQPAFRSGGNLAYDAARKLHILFGTQFGDHPGTWAYDLRKNEWRDLKPQRQPPTDRNDAVLAYNSRNRVVIALVRVIDKQDGKEVLSGHLETWAFDAGKNTWTPMKPPREPDGWGNRRRVMTYLPDLNVVLSEHYVNPTERVPDVAREQQIWTYRYGEGKPEATPAPTDVRVDTASNSAFLEWDSRPKGKETGYVVYRGDGAKPWQAELRAVGRVAKGKNTFEDKGLKPGTIYFYSVRPIGGDGREIAAGIQARSQPGIVENAAVAVVSPTEVSLSWKRDDCCVKGYHVERAPVEVFSEDQIIRLKKDTEPLAEPSVGAVKAIGAFTRLTKEPIRATRQVQFTDRGLDLAKPQAVDANPVFVRRFRPDQLDAKGKPYRYGVYAYRIRAVNALGVESGPSPYFLTIPSAPQWLFSKENGKDCQLKWAANPEEKLKGYRVYRMESPRINGPGQKVTRVTAEPIAEPRYSDAGIGEKTRRYWVVAVDALGQEGFPSAPTWHYRQYRRYYLPFTGEWHQ